MTLPEPLQGMADRSPLMLVFLRHFGCTFCRETLADIARQKDAIAATGAQVAFVHMSEPGDADRWFEHYDVADMTRISDPQKHLYRLFALEEGSLNQLAHPRVWWPWFRTAVIAGHGGAALGDALAAEKRARAHMPRRHPIGHQCKAIKAWHHGQQAKSP